MVSYSLEADRSNANVLIISRSVEHITLPYGARIGSDYLGDRFLSTECHKDVMSQRIALGLTSLLQPHMPHTSSNFFLFFFSDNRL
jgi:hypothetical protein